jgi:hypothetical protein
MSQLHVISTDLFGSTSRVMTGCAEKVGRMQVNMAVAEANAFALASHIYWGVWSVVQARFSLIDFDYFDYGDRRWSEYHRRKAEVEQMVQLQFPSPVDLLTS